jgi:hypothetical protein
MASAPPAPTTFQGSDLEWMVYWALTVPLKRIPNQDFTFQSALYGGKHIFGGIVVDFLMNDGTNIGIDIEGEYWHYGNSEDMANAIIRRERVAAAGITLIFIDGHDIQSNVVYYVQEALAGIDHSRISRN